MLAVFIPYVHLGPFWSIALIAVGCVVALCLLLAIVIFVGTRFEVIRLVQWQDLDPAQMPKSRPAAIDQAIGQGLELLRTGRLGDSSLLTGHDWLLASPDRTILMIAGSNKLGSTFSFTSRRRDGVWLITKQAVGTPLRQGTRAILDEIQTANMTDTLTLHRQRVQEAAGEVEPFTDAEAGQWIAAALRATYEDLIDHRMAAWTDAGKQSLKLTVAGSFRAALGALLIPMRISRNQARATELAKIQGSLPPLWRPPCLEAEVLPPLSGPLVGNMVVIASQLADATQTYMHYQAEGEIRLPVFPDQQQAMAYAALIPTAQGEMRTFIEVTPQWLQACMENGYRVVLNPHLATARPLSPADLQMPIS